MWINFENIKARRKLLEQERSADDRLFECCRRFLRALQESRAQSRLLYLLYDEEHVLFLKNSTSFFHCARSL